MKDKKSIMLTVNLKTLTGLHIGISKDIAEIGGLDAPVIRNPITNLPYIPGSSLKGKIRCLIEMSGSQFGKEGKGFDGHDGGPCACDDPDCPICRVFGSLNKNAQPTRIIVRDAELSQEGIKLFEDQIKRGLSPMEIKTEISIDRLKGSVKKGALITKERIPPGFDFSFNIVYRAFLAKNDDEIKDDKKLIEEGLNLLQADTLGGSGSRGYGQVELSWGDWVDAW